ncbi:hypothetical protein GCM10027098_31560 [Bowmanella dokdonensis]
MLVLTTLFAVLVVLLVYSLSRDKGKNTKYFRHHGRTERRPIMLKKKPLKMGDSLF